VHDLGSGGPLEPGACFTVEPGIYIPPNSKCDPKWWNIGVRIEDDVLITPTGHRNLSIGAPRTVAEVEKMAKGKSVFK
jgi:Xaa-Pro aminopeptidase